MITPRPPKKGDPFWGAKDFAWLLKKARRKFRGGPGIRVSEKGGDVVISATGGKSWGGEGGAYEHPFLAQCVRHSETQLKFTIRDNSFYYFNESSDTPKGTPFQVAQLTGLSAEDFATISTDGTTDYGLYLKVTPKLTITTGGFIQFLWGGAEEPNDPANTNEYVRPSASQNASATVELKALELPATFATDADYWPVAEFSVSETEGDVTITKLAQYLESNPYIVYPIVQTDFVPE